MKIGDLRPTQLIYTFGVGSVLDLPNMSALVMGLDDWDENHCPEILEDRLIAAINQRTGGAVRRLRIPPVETEGNGADQGGAIHGVPVAPFPRWMRCTRCKTLASIEDGFFTLEENRYRPEETHYIHRNCLANPEMRPPKALPVRFLLACREGHLSDFPWLSFVHKDTSPCRGAQLTLREFGISGDASDIIVKCHAEGCGKERRMSDAFDPDYKPACRGLHPHIRRKQTEPCEAQAKATLLGASNTWFPNVMSAISLPSAGDGLAELVEDHWAELSDVEGPEVVRFATRRIPDFADHTVEAIWSAIQARRNGTRQPDAEAGDLKTTEWQALTSDQLPSGSRDFLARRVGPPAGYEAYFEPSVLLERIREVRALISFTRVESNGDFAEAEAAEEDRNASLSRTRKDWLPAAEVRGEGLFLHFKESMIAAWEQRHEIKELEKKFLASHRVWRTMRRQAPPSGLFPGIRYVLLHSFSHALMRQISLECGYTAASIRERIFSALPSERNGPMAGILLYTAASDSEGTLGGLVHLGQPMTMGRLVTQALESMRLCGSDPLCSDQEPTENGRMVHGSSCHACLFAPETSCEKGNRFLDRSTLISTFSERGLEFFPVN
jgi:hypothetical protein